VKVNEVFLEGQKATCTTIEKGGTTKLCEVTYCASISILKSRCARRFAGNETSNLSANSGTTEGKSYAASFNAKELLE